MAVTLSLNPSTVDEGAAATDITVTASLGSTTLPTATAVTVSVSGGTATSGMDYPAISDFTVTIPANATSGTATLSFDPTEDILVEGDETVVLTGAATGLTSGSATLTITDNDTAPMAVMLSLNPSTVPESAAATSVTVTASLGSSGLPTSTTVSVSVTGGTATSGMDYAAVSIFPVTISAGQTSGTATLSFDPTEDTLVEGDETVVLTGSATGLTSGSATLTITDNDNNNAPTVARPLQDQFAFLDTPFSYTFLEGTFHDADNDTLTYTATHADGTALPAWLSFNAGTRTFAGTPGDADEGTVSVRVTANDGHGGSVSDTFTITVREVGVLKVDFGTAAPSDPVRMHETVNRHRLLFFLSGEAPRALTIPLVVTHLGGATTADYTGLPGSVTFQTGEKVTSFVMRAVPDRTLESDEEGLRLDFGVLPEGVSKGTWGPYEIIKFVDGPVNANPVVANPIPNMSAKAGTPFTYTFPSNTFSDADNDPLTYTATLPTWLKFNAGTRTFKGTPGTSDAETVAVTVTASDGHGGSISHAFAITVNPAANSAPVVAQPIPDITADLNTRFSFKFPSHTFSDADNDTLTYTATQPGGTALPAWLSFDAGGRFFRGTPRPADEGTVSVRVTANDGNGGSVSDTFTITVEDAGDLAVDFGTAVESAPIRVREGGSIHGFSLLLNGEAPQGLTIPIVVTHLGGATTADHTPIPESVTFEAGRKSASFRMRAIADEILETGEGLRFDFGPLPPGVRKGTWGPYEIIEFVDAPVAQANLSVVGPLLTLGYPGALDGGSKPSPRDFVVTAEAPGSARAMVAVTAVSVRGTDVFLDLDRPVTPDETVTLTYLAAAMHPIRDAAGLPLPPLASEPVHNETGASAPRAKAAPEGGTALPAPLAAVLAAAPDGAGTERLDLSSRNLTDVSALAGLVGLRELDLRDNAITDLSPLAGLTSLERLNLAGNAVADIAMLGGLTGLRTLDLADNRVADLWPLAGLTSLERLNLAGNAVADIAMLGGLTGLRTLDLADNRVTDLSPLAGLTSLERLNLAGNRIAGIGTLAGLGGLEVLLLDRNQVTDVSALSQLAGLANLGLAGNRIADIATLAELGGLLRLDLSDNGVSDVSALGDLSGLVWLRLPGNPLSSAAPLVRLANLRWLWLDPATAPAIETLVRPAGQGAAPRWIERAPAR